MHDYYDCSNLPLRFSDALQFHAGEEASLPELLAALQKEINSHIESLRRNGCPKQKIVDLATLIDIMLEKDLDRLDRMLLYRLSSQNGRFDPRLFQWLESLALAYWFHEFTEDDLWRLLSHLAYPSTENSRSGAETLNSHSKEVELTPASGKADGGAQTEPNRSYVDEVRPIAFEEAPCEFVRVDMEPLRKVQAQVNDFINRLCSSRSFSTEVFYVCRVLAHVVDTDFSGIGILSQLLESANRPATGSSDDVLNALKTAAYHIERGVYSAEELRKALTELWNKKRDEREKAIVHSEAEPPIDTAQPINHG
jgi:hypothetical protein